MGASDYWYRFEWQHRGSPHVHGLAWFEGAPDAQQVLDRAESERYKYAYTIGSMYVNLVHIIINLPFQQNKFVTTIIAVPHTHLLWLHSDSYNQSQLLMHSFSSYLPVPSSSSSTTLTRSLAPSIQQFNQMAMILIVLLQLKSILTPVMFPMLKSRISTRISSISLLHANVTPGVPLHTACVL